MATENEDLENKVSQNIIYASLAGLFFAGGAFSAIGAQYEPDHAITLYGMSTYSTALAGFVGYWWYKATRP